MATAATTQTQVQRLTFDVIEVGMKVRYEDVTARQSDDSSEANGSGTVYQKTQHLVVIDNGKYKVSGSRISIRLGWFKVWPA